MRFHVSSINHLGSNIRGCNYWLWNQLSSAGSKSSVHGENKSSTPVTKGRRVFPNTFCCMEWQNTEFAGECTKLDVYPFSPNLNLLFCVYPCARFCLHNFEDKMFLLEKEIQVFLLTKVTENYVEGIQQTLQIRLWTKCFIKHNRTILCAGHLFWYCF